MQRYKCHKEVEAAKILAVGPGSVTDHLLVRVVNSADGVGVEEEIQVPPAWGTRYRPVGPNDLGYLVRYEDGYLSWSPTKAFEGGYTLIPPAGGDLPDDFEVN